MFSKLRLQRLGRVLEETSLLARSWRPCCHNNRGWVEGENKERIGKDSMRGLGIDRGTGIVETGGRKGRGREGEGEGE